MFVSRNTLQLGSLKQDQPGQRGRPGFFLFLVARFLAIPTNLTKPEENFKPVLQKVTANVSHNSHSLHTSKYVQCPANSYIFPCPHFAKENLVCYSLAATFPSSQL